VLRDPAVAVPPGADLAAEALSVERSSAVRRALGIFRTGWQQRICRATGAAEEIVRVVEEFGLREVEPPPLPTRNTEDDLGVVCWMAVLPPR